MYKRFLNKPNEWYLVMLRDKGIPKDIAEFLISRGLNTYEKIERFFNFKEENLRKVSEMKDGVETIKAIIDAINNKKNIVIYGDYDTDGVCATAIMKWGLKWLGCEANHFINNRFTEGYGLCEAGVSKLFAEFPDTDLIITVDNGIIAFEGIEYAKKCGADVLVTDHHTASPDGRLPKTTVLCEKRLDENQEALEGICGAELARRLITEVAKEMGKYEEMKDEFNSLYSFSACATIADVIDMNAANHFIVKTGLEAIKNETFPCWTALRIASKTTKIDEETIGWYYSPLINALGRLTGEVEVPLLLCVSDDLKIANTLVEEMVEANNKRKEITAEEKQMAVDDIINNAWDNDKFLVVEGDFHEGINGLIAGELAKTYNVPAISLCPSNEPEVLKGSARSVGDVNIKTLLDQCADLLVAYGGHAGAAGLSVRKENINKLRQRLNELCQDYEYKEEIHYDVYFDDGSKEVYQHYKDIINALAPFGPGFERPVFATRGRIDTKRTKVLKEKHMKILLEGKNINVLWWNSADKYKNIMEGKEGKTVTFIGKPDINVFNGRITFQMVAESVVVR